MPTFRPIVMSTVQYDAELRTGQIQPAEVLGLARRLGVDGVELRDVYWSDKAAEILTCRALSVELGLTLTYATFARIFDVEPNGRESVRQAIVDGAALGARIVRIFPGPVPDDSKKSEWDQSEALVRFAAEQGVTLALENFARSPGGTLEEVASTLDRFRQSSIGANVDIGNYAQNGQDVPTAIERLNDRVAYAHLKHMRKVRDSSEATFLGGGDNSLDLTLAAFARLPQPVTFCLEFAGGGDPEGRIQKSVAFLAGNG